MLLSPRMENHSKYSPKSEFTPRPSGRRVLLIEDDADVAESLRLLLEYSGHSLTVAFDGAAGLQAVHASRPEIILCDLGLPGKLDGYEVARALRRDYPANAFALVAMTGSDRDEDRIRSREAGFDSHLVKPVDPAALELVISRL